MILDYIKYLLPVAVVLGSYGYGYYSGRSDMIDKLKVQQLENATKIVETERAMQSAQNEIISQYITELNDLKAREKELNEKVKKAAIRDTVVVHGKCVSDSKAGTGVPTKTADKPDLRCYSETELRRKIEQSVAITAECDELAARYNNLLRICKQ